MESSQELEPLPDEIEELVYIPVPRDEDERYAKSFCPIFELEEAKHFFKELGYVVRFPLYFIQASIMKLG